MTASATADTKPWYITWSGYLLAASGAFLFASKGIWIKFAYRYGIDAGSLIALRLLFTTPVFILIGVVTWMRARKAGTHNLPPITARPELYLKALAVGALGYWLASWTDFQSLTTLSPQFERLILFTYPLFVIIFGALFFHQKMRAGAVWAFLISYAGLMTVFVTDVKAQGWIVAHGVAWCTTSSIAFAFYLLLAKPMIARFGPSLFTSWAMTGAAIATIVQFLLTHHLSDLHMSSGLFNLVIGLSVGATVVPIYLTNFALSRISSQANAIIGFISPVFTLIMSALLLREQITFADVVGTLLVLVGIGLYTWLDQRAKF